MIQTIMSLIQSYHSSFRPVTGMAGYDLMDSGEYRPIILCD